MVDKDDKSALLSQLTIDKVEPASAEKRWITSLIAGTVGLLVGVGLSSIFSASRNVEREELNNIEQKLPVIEPVHHQQMPLKEQDLKEVLNASGYITARRVATVSSEIMGLIVSVDVEEGMSVDKGQVLAQLDNTIAKVNLDLAIAQVDAQKARVATLYSEVNEAKRVLSRISKLEGENFTSEAQLSRATTDLDAITNNIASAKAELTVSQLNVTRLEENYNRHTIRAPFAGVITVKNAQMGEIVAPAAAGGGYTRTGICTIVDMGSLEIEVDVNEAYINRVFPGQKVIANLDAYPEWSIPASVIAVIPTAIRAKATVQVRIKIEEKDARILPDMGIKVAFLK